LAARKLIIQIPCFNEEASLPITFGCLPRAVPGYDTVETLVLDDGSTDRTAAVARDLGATHVLELPHRGLAQTFITGVRHALSLGAHTVVNLDADNQYCADDVATITAPIVAGAAGVVIGERPLRSIERFSPLKRRLHLAGNAFLRRLTGTPVTDATSGFRALRHDVASRVDIRSSYTYTVEMLLELSLAGVPITFVPVRVSRGELRPSRLIRSNAQYLFKNSCIIVRTLARRRRGVRGGGDAEPTRRLEIARPILRECVETEAVEPPSPCA
jgi:glycosyltransferase involved in cell wall biosynthesis